MIVLAVEAVPSRTLPAWTQTLPPLAFFLLVALLCDIDGGSGSSLAPLALLPVVWLALYGTRGQLLAGILGAMRSSWPRSWCSESPGTHRTSGRRRRCGWSSQQLRGTDLLARYGGVEFAAAFPGCPLGQAVQLTERRRTLVPAPCTVSFGVACWDGAESVDAFMERAGVALAGAKGGGRRSRRRGADGVRLIARARHQVRCRP